MAPNSEFFPRTQKQSGSINILTSGKQSFITQTALCCHWAFLFVCLLINPRKTNHDVNISESSRTQTRPDKESGIHPCSAHPTDTANLLPPTLCLCLFSWSNRFYLCRSLCTQFKQGHHLSSPSIPVKWSKQCNVVFTKTTRKKENI